MAILAPRRASRTSRGANFAGIEITPEALLENAQSVSTRLAEYAKRPAPERPEALDVTDEFLREAARKSERKARMTKAEQDALALFGTWRAAVFKIEEENRGSLLMLLGCLNRLEATEGADQAARKIREYILTEYRATLPEPAPWACSNWGENWSARYAQQRNVLQLALRSLTSGSVARQPARQEEPEEETTESW